MKLKYDHPHSIITKMRFLTRVEPADVTADWALLSLVGPTAAIPGVDLPAPAVTPVPADARQVTFDGFGRIVANVDASATLTCLKVTNTNVSSPHKLNVTIGIGGLSGGTKLCDPAASAGEPQACPAACKN